MGDAETITRNTGSLFVGEVVVRVLSLIFFVMIARILGASEFGVYSFAFAIASIFLIFSDLGLATLLIKEVAKDRKKSSDYLSNIFSLKFFATLAFTIVTIIIFINVAVKETAIAVTIVMLASFFNAITEPFRNIFLAFEKHHYYAMMNIFERAISTILGILLLLKGYGLIPVLCVFVISYALNFAVSSIIVWKKFTHFSLSFEIKKWLHMLRQSWPFLLSLLFMAIYYRIGIIMLKIMLKSNDVVGWYNSAFGLVDSLSFIPLIIATAVFPAMSRFHTESRKFLGMVYEKAFYYLAIIAIPVAFATTMLAGKIITSLYTAEYSPAILALQLLVWSEVFIFFNYLIGYLLNATDKQHLFARATATYLVINIILNLALIPKFQHIGVAASAIVTQAIGFVMLFYFSTRNGYTLNVLKLALKPLGASLAMCIVLYATNHANLFLQIAAGGLSYAAVLFLLGGVGKDEFKLIRNVLRL
jgi:O-antigen/teichoic acid export membrane protein